MSDLRRACGSPWASLLAGRKNSFIEVAYFTSSKRFYTNRIKNRNNNSDIARIEPRKNKPIYFGPLRSSYWANNTRLPVKRSRLRKLSEKKYEITELAYVLSSENILYIVTFDAVIRNRNTNLPSNKVGLLR